VTTVESDDAHVVAVRLHDLGELPDVVRALDTHGEVIADLDNFELPRRQRAFDVLSGVAYALDARMTRYHGDRCRYRLSRDPY
jgi:FtsZ-interacting cell division protein YlmF